MSYNTAYTSHFNSLAGVSWRLEIGITDFSGQPMDVGLDAEQPIVIEWQETELSDAVCPSLCTVKVVNDKDRQMLTLMHRRDALCSVYRNNSLYWRGLLDDSVYEEPYSYKDGYITELTFSDFGILNGKKFDLFGILSLSDIVNDCLGSCRLDGLAFEQTGSLKHTDGTPVLLSNLYINTAAFKDMTKRDVLEGILQALSLRIQQKSGSIFVYDIEQFAEDCPASNVTWKGTDAMLKGSVVFGSFEITFDRKTEPVIADGSIDPETSRFWMKQNAYLAPYPASSDEEGFYVDFIRFPWSMFPIIDECNIFINGRAKFARTRGVLTKTHEAFIAHRIRCIEVATNTYRDLISQSTPTYLNDIGNLFAIVSDYIPSVSNSDDFELCVNLDLLVSPLSNPFEEPYPGEENAVKWEKWKNKMKRLYVPVKIEAIDENNIVLAHYVNTSHQNVIAPSDYGTWKPGPAEWGDSLLAYYNDGLKESPFIGWVTNRKTTSAEQNSPNNIYRNKKNGEYIRMPDNCCRIRLTVGDGIVVSYKEHNNQQPSVNWEYGGLCWQLYRNPKITVVKSGVADDEINTENDNEKLELDNNTNRYTETTIIGSGGDSASPAAHGVLIDGNGIVIDKFEKNGSIETLLKHRLNSLVDRLGRIHPKLSGTAEINDSFCLLSDSSTQGVFLPVAALQNLAEDTEDITMTRVSEGTTRYSAQWSMPVCALEEERYTYEWSGPVCVRLPDHYSYAWSGPVCARRQVTIGPTWETLE